MFLFEEYLQRHNLSYNGPQHCWFGGIVLKTDPEIWNHKWLFVSIQWVPEAHHPGNYLLNFYNPVHNGEVHRPFLEEKPLTLSWDNYEEWMFSWISKCQGKPLVQKTKRGWELILSLWEIFVFIFDDWFSNHPFRIKEQLFASLDNELPIKQRYENYQAISLFLQQQHPQIYKVWEKKILFYFHNYSEWLVNLFRQSVVRRYNI